MPDCLICKTDYEPFISFGNMPIANGFLTPDRFKDEYFFELKAGFCSKCNTVQLVEQPAREMMFNEKYPFFSSTSTHMASHFKELAETVIREYLPSPDPFVIELGSNDGIMLQNFALSSIRHLGIEPSTNVAQVAIKKGIQTVCKFFDEELANHILIKHGQADVFLGANVMCHIPYIHSIIKGIKILLKDKGIVIFEDPYIGDVIENTTYDQIYDEHVFLFSVSSVKYLFDTHGFEVIDVKPQKTHGGSMRYFVGHKGSHPVSDRVYRQLEDEDKLGLTKEKTYRIFRKNCEHSRNSLMELINNLKAQGKSIVGYAATSKSTTIINYCGISTDHLDYICDTTPIKQGRYSPGAHIPIRPYDYFLSNYPDYALLFAYNHSNEIMAKEKRFIDQGGRWVTYMPEVKVL